MPVYSFLKRYDFRLKFYNMKKNVNMNTLTNEEKQVKEATQLKKKDFWYSSFAHLGWTLTLTWTRIMQGIWVPKLVFSNTEQKINTKNDEKAFAVAR